LSSIKRHFFHWSLLKALEKKFRFTDYWGPRLYDARGNQIEWPNRPRLPIQVGKPIRFFRGQSEIKAPEADGASNE
jgi:hypothetical protein